MKKRFKIITAIAILLLALNVKSSAQSSALSGNYAGFIPSFLVEPYDTINAVEINLFPFLYEFRLGEENDIGVQLRSILNYRFFKPQSGISQIGGTLLVNKYIRRSGDDDYWLIPQVGAYYTYAYNRLDKIHTMTLGIEPGLFMQLSGQWSISVNLQPGINYYPDEASQDFVGTKSGFKGHFGVVVHAGYNF